MTNKEILEGLESLKKYCEDCAERHINLISYWDCKILKMAIEALENQEAEKERIIKELQSEALDNLIKKNRRDGFGEYELCAGMPEYHYREGFLDSIYCAIDIVKRGGVSGKDSM